MYSAYIILYIFLCKELLEKYMKIFQSHNLPAIYKYNRI